MLFVGPVLTEFSLKLPLDRPPTITDTKQEAQNSTPVLPALLLEQVTLFSGASFFSTTTTSLVTDIGHPCL